MNKVTTKTDIDALREDIRKFHKEISREFYLHTSGQKDDLNIASIYERHGHLFSEDLAKNCRDRWESAEDADAKRTWKHLYKMAFFGLIGEKCKKIVEETAKKQNELKITVRGEEIGYHTIIPKLTNEPDKEVRTELDFGLAECENQLNGFREEAWDITYGILRDFGYESYREGCRKTSGVDFEWLAGELREFLKETEEEYVRSFDDLSNARLGYPIAEARKCDLAYLMKAQTWDPFFPKEGMVEKSTGFLTEMGMPVEKVNAVNLDIAEREKKRPRAFCSPVEVGKEIYVCLRPMGGSNDYLTFLHELGHAYHFAHTDSELPAELILVGDSATSEIFAFNFNYLGVEPKWLKKYLDMKEPEPFVEHQRLVKLYMLRRYASKFLYELELHSDFNMSNKKRLYAKYLDEGLKAKHREEHWLYDLDDAYYSAGYLRAWIFEYQLREHLKQEYGEEWWESPDAGKFMKEMWRTGRMYMPEEISERMLGRSLDLGPIKREVSRQI